MKAFLTAKQRNVLIEAHRKERCGKRRDRIKVVLWSDEGITQEEIAHRLFMSVDTVSRHWEAYKEEERLTANHKGSKPILMQKESDALSAHLETKIYTKVKDIQAYILTIFNKKMALPTIRQWLKSHGFSYKKPVLRPKSVNHQQQQEFVEYYHKLMTEAALNDQPVLFGDAVHPTQQTQAVYGWIKRGQDKAIETTAGRKRINLLGALNLATMDLTRHEFDTIDGTAVVTFLKRVESAYPHASAIHLILDRAGYNTCEEVQKYLATSRIRVHFLPPRSPNLNPIERLWKIMHEYVSYNRVHEKFKDFKKALFHFFDVTMFNIKDELLSRITDIFQVFPT